MFGKSKRNLGEMKYMGAKTSVGHRDKSRRGSVTQYRLIGCVEAECLVPVVLRTQPGGTKSLEARFSR